jgi:hypothetical protein
LPVAYTNVFAVPRSIARSDENMRKSVRPVIVERYPAWLRMAMLDKVNYPR